MYVFWGQLRYYIKTPLRCTLCQVVSKLNSALAKAALVRAKADSMPWPQVRGNYSFSNSLTWGQRTCKSENPRTALFFFKSFIVWMSIYNTPFEPRQNDFFGLVCLIVDPIFGSTHLAFKDSSFKYIPNLKRIYILSSNTAGWKQLIYYL